MSSAAVGTLFHESMAKVFVRVTPNGRSWRPRCCRSYQCLRGLWVTMIRHTPCLLHKNIARVTYRAVRLHFSRLSPAFSIGMTPFNELFTHAGFTVAAKQGFSSRPSELVWLHLNLWQEHEQYVSKHTRDVCSPIGTNRNMPFAYVKCW